MTETPARDRLSDLLSGMHLAGMVLFRGDFREPWSVSAPAFAELAQALPMSPGQHLIPFHVIATGGCWLTLPGSQPLWLKRGDAVLLPYGDSHALGGRDATPAVGVGQLLPRPPWNEMPCVEHGGRGAATRIVCGFLQCDEWLIHPLLRHLPPVLHVRPGRGAGDRWLATTLRRTASEAGQPTPGSRTMLPRLTEVMFVEILRKHMQGLSDDEVGWFAACNDAVAGAALGLLHEAPLDDWSVERLARRVGVSRTVLVERFKRFLEHPPMRYLARWRLQLAAQELRATALPVKTIADRIGYESEASFSRAFKRHFGLPPSDLRGSRSDRRPRPVH